MLAFIGEILPTLPTGTPKEILLTGVDFFETWISRAGGLVAFIGAVKLGLSLKTEDEKEQMNSVMIMVSGFMVVAAVSELKLFNIPDVYSEAAANAEFKSIMNFIGKWTRRAGLIGAFLGGVSFCLAIKDNNAVAKISALKGLAAGGCVMAISGILHMFV